MRVFVTGASGFIGSAVVPELLGAGHQVLGLARSDASAQALSAAGAEVARGTIDDVDVLRSAAESSDGVVHLAYNHDFGAMQDAAATDRRAIDAFGDALAGSDRPLVIASGTLGLAVGRLATERDSPAAGVHPRAANAIATVELASRGVRSAVVRFAPSVHGEADQHGFVPVLIQIARDKGRAAYIGDGANRWPGVHQLDAAALVRLVVENATAGTSWHAVGDEGIATREIAELIGRGLDVPVESIDPGDAGAHFGWMGAFFGADVPASNEITRETLGWSPTHPGLVEDLGQGFYFDGRPNN